MRRRLKELHEQRDRLRVEIRRIEDGTLPYLEEHGRTTSAEVSAEFDVSLQTASNRLRSLWMAGLAERELITGNGHETGRSNFVYWPAEGFEVGRQT